MQYILILLGYAAVFGLMWLAIDGTFKWSQHRKRRRYDAKLNSPQALFHRTIHELAMDDDKEVNATARWLRAQMHLAEHADDSELMAIRFPKERKEIEKKPEPDPEWWSLPVVDAERIFDPATSVLEEVTWFMKDGKKYAIKEPVQQYAYTDDNGVHRDILGNKYNDPHDLGSF